MKRIICIFLCFLTVTVPLLSFAGCSNTPNDEMIYTDNAASTKLSLSANTDIYYGRYALSLMSNSAALLYAYDKITEGIAKSDEEIIIYNGNDSISREEAEMAFDAYRRDHAEHFWLGSSYTMTYNTETVTKLAPSYIMTGTELENAKLELENAVSGMLADIDGTMSDYEKELILHDKLAAKVTYVETDNAHNAYGALVEGKAVCEGYAEALQYLLHRVGIQSFLILGTSKNPSANGEYESHAWNAVKIDGSFYHVDLTWNDQGNYLFHSYFNQSDSIISLDHEITLTDYPLPVCNTDTANYFKKSGTYLTSYTVDSVAELLKNNNYTVNVYLPENVDAFISWYKTSISSIAMKAGVHSTFSYGQIKLGNEVMLILNVCRHYNVSPIAAVAATCTESGNIAHYKCLYCEKLFSDSTATTEISNIYSVLTDPIPHTYTKKVLNTAYLKYEAQSCQEYDCYWYSCKDCTANAKNDPVAQDKWYESTDVGDHSFDVLRWGYRNESGHAHDCTVPGCDAHDEVVPHISSGAATETVAEKCTSCQYIITPALNHTAHTPSSSWETDSTYHWHKCIGCEDQIFDKSEHSYKNDCDTDCDVCGEVRSAEHSFSEVKTDGQSHWNECVCGEKTGVTAHTDVDEDGKCDECKGDIKAPDNTSPLKNLGKKAIIILIVVVASACTLTVIICVVIKKLGNK